MIVSGFKTSPLDSFKIDSGEASPIEILLNLFIGFLSLLLFLVFRFVSCGVFFTNKPMIDYITHIACCACGCLESRVTRYVKKKVTYFVNKFGPVGPIFFYPILRLLALTIAKNTSSDIDKSRRGQGSSKDTTIRTNREYQIKPDNFKESFIRNSLSSPELKVEKKVVSVAIEEEDGDGLHSMIPCEALLALAMFVKCSVNTLCQR